MNPPERAERTFTGAVDARPALQGSHARMKKSYGKRNTSSLEGREAARSNECKCTYPGVRPGACHDRHSPADRSPRRCQLRSARAGGALLPADDAAATSACE